MALTPSEHVDVGGSFGTAQALTANVDKTATANGKLVVYGIKDANYYCTINLNSIPIGRICNPETGTLAVPTIMGFDVRQGDVMKFIPKAGTTGYYAAFYPYA